MFYKDARYGNRAYIVYVAGMRGIMPRLRLRGARYGNRGYVGWVAGMRGRDTAATSAGSQGCAVGMLWLRRLGRRDAR